MNSLLGGTLTQQQQSFQQQQPFQQNFHNSLQLQQQPLQQQQFMQRSAPSPAPFVQYMQQQQQQQQPQQQQNFGYNVYMNQQGSNNVPNSNNNNSLFQQQPLQQQQQLNLSQRNYLQQVMDASSGDNFSMDKQQFQVPQFQQFSQQQTPPPPQQQQQQQQQQLQQQQQQPFQSTFQQSSNAGYIEDVLQLVVEQQRRITQLEQELEKARTFISRLQEFTRQLENEKQKHNKKQSRYWTQQEHQRFLEAIQKFGRKDVKAIASYVGSRNPTQVRTHAQKYYAKMERETRKSKDDVLDAGNNQDSITPSNSSSSKQSMSSGSSDDGQRDGSEAYLSVASSNSSGDGGGGSGNGGDPMNTTSTSLDGTVEVDKSMSSADGLIAYKGANMEKI